MDSSSQIVRNECVELSRVGERAVLYHRETGKALVLNPSGSWLWEQLNSPRTREQLAAALQSHYSLPSDQATMDVERFLDDLAAHDAISRS